ncbi:phosphotransferase [Nocardioides sp. SYSU D00038]|uniref:phosphotransferase n=1 Tax=Nocardioides sp. SYSU D00038 TaxID=2812554 RepID=UPI0019671C88|nr:phosphotransferase [Nocardioides sp. SYSU D00038]
MPSHFDHDILVALRQCVGDVELVSLQDVSPGLSGSQVLKATCKDRSGQAGAWYLKGASTSSYSPLGLDNELNSARERAVYRTPYARQIPGIEIPAAQVTDDNRWICMEDRSESIGQPYDPRLAGAVMDRLAGLAEFSSKLPRGWQNRFPFVRCGWMTYAGFIDEALDNLTQVERAELPFAGAQLSHFDIGTLRRLLLEAQDISSLAEDLPTTILHGDLNPSNCGISPVGNLVLIDFEQVGIGPIGSDAATFTMLYKRFGGTGTWTTEDAIHHYRRALVQRGVEVELTQIYLAFAIWQCTWGLHLRLGPGMSFLLRESDSANLVQAHDVFDGLRAAVAFSERIFA